MMERLLAKIDANQERLQAEMNVIRKKIETNQDKIDANDEKFEVLRVTLVSPMDIHRDRTRHSRSESEDGHIRRRWRPQYTPSGPS
jgi:hypothetical protein